VGRRSISGVVPSSTAAPTWPKTSRARHPAHRKGRSQSETSSWPTAPVKKAKPSMRTESGRDLASPSVSCPDQSRVHRRRGTRGEPLRRALAASVTTWHCGD
jgi:hypothetical protein